MKSHSDKESEEANMINIVTGNGNDDDVDEVQCDIGNANPNQINSGPEATTISQNDATLEAGVYRRKKEE